MPDLGELRARFVVDDQQWSSGLARVQGALSTGVAGLKAASDSLAGFRSELLRAGGDSDELGDRLAGAFGELADAKRKFAEQQLVLGFDPQQIGDALITLNKFGVDGESALLRLQDASRFTGVEVTTLAERFGQFEKFGDAKSLKALLKTIGASGADLQKFGAVVDGNNQVLLDTEARANAARDAVNAYLDATSSGAAARAADVVANLTGEFELLKIEIGKNSVAFQEQFAPAALFAVQALRALPDEAKAFVGVGVELVSELSSVTQGAIAMGAQLVILGSNATVARLATAAFTNGVALARAAMLAFAGPAGVLAVAALGLAAYTKALEDSNKAAESLLQAEEKRADGFRKNKDVIGKSATELLAMGKTTADVTAAIGGLQEQVQAAREAGNTRLQGDLVAKIQNLRQVRAELDAATKSQAAKSQQSALDADGPKRAAQAQREQNAEQRKAAQEAETARKNELASQLDAIRLQAAAGALSAAAQVQAYQGILASAQLTAKERVNLEIQIAQLQTRIRNEQLREDQRASRERLSQQQRNAREQLADAKKAKRDEAQETRKAEREAAGSLRSGERQAEVDKRAIERAAQEKANIQKETLDRELAKLEEEGKTTNVLPAIEANLAKQLKLRLDSIEKEKQEQLASAKSAEAKAAIVESAEAQMQAAREKSTTQLQQLTKRQQDALQSVADKSKAVAAEVESITTRIGGKNSPIFSDPTEGLGIKLGNFSFGNLQKPQSQAKPQVVAEVKPALKADTTPAPVLQQKPPPDLGKAVASSLRDAPINITVQVTAPGGKTSSKTFAGSASDLERATNQFNPDHQLGRF